MHGYVMLYFVLYRHNLEFCSTRGPFCTVTVDPPEIFSHAIVAFEEDLRLSLILHSVLYSHNPTFSVFAEFCNKLEFGVLFPCSFLFYLADFQWPSKPSVMAMCNTLWSFA